MTEQQKPPPSNHAFHWLYQWKLVFRREHQFPVFLLVLLGLVGMGIYFSWQGFVRGPLADIDHVPRTSALYQIDLNSADWPELVVLPGVGEKLAKAIVEHRNRIGRFKDHQEILDIHGIGEIKLSQLRPHLLPISK